MNRIGAIAIWILNMQTFLGFKSIDFGGPSGVDFMAT